MKFYSKCYWTHRLEIHDTTGDGRSAERGESVAAAGRDSRRSGPGSSPRFPFEAEGQSRRLEISVQPTDYPPRTKLTVNLNPGGRPSPERGTPFDTAGPTTAARYRTRPAVALPLPHPPLSRVSIRKQGAAAAVCLPKTSAWRHARASFSRQASFNRTEKKKRKRKIANYTGGWWYAPRSNGGWFQCSCPFLQGYNFCLLQDEWRSLWRGVNVSGTRDKYDNVGIGIVCWTRGIGDRWETRGWAAMVVQDANYV